MHSVPPFSAFMFWITGTTLTPPDLVQAQNVHAAVSLAAVKVVCFNANLLPNGSDERQRSGRIKAGGCWFESGRCVGP